MQKLCLYVICCVASFNSVIFVGTGCFLAFCEKKYIDKPNKEMPILQIFFYSAIDPAVFVVMFVFLPLLFLPIFMVLMQCCAAIRWANNFCFRFSITTTSIIGFFALSVYGFCASDCKNEVTTQMMFMISSVLHIVFMLLLQYQLQQFQKYFNNKNVSKLLLDHENRKIDNINIM